MPKMVSEVNLDLKSDGKVLTGVAQAAYWPGEMLIKDGKVDGDRIRLAWSARARGSWDSVIIYGNVENKPQEYEMAGERVQ